MEISGITRVPQTRERNSLQLEERSAWTVRSDFSKTLSSNPKLTEIEFTLMKTFPTFSVLYLVLVVVRDIYIRIVTFGYNKYLKYIRVDHTG